MRNAKTNICSFFSSVFLPMVPSEGSMGLHMDFLSFFFYVSTPPTFGSKYDICGQLGVGGTKNIHNITI